MLVIPSDGPRINNERDAVELIGAASQCGASVVAVPIERLNEDFFRLRTGIAGAIIQKFVTYNLRLVVVGDISRHLEESSALRDFVTEANRGGHVWFCSGVDELHNRLELP
jgi:hypothetical protein